MSAPFRQRVKGWTINPYETIVGNSAAHVKRGPRRLTAWSQALAGSIREPAQKTLEKLDMIGNKERPRCESVDGFDCFW
jgi:hypothetical protein